VGDQLSLQLAPITNVYQPRGINALQCLFKKHFQSFLDEYEAKHAMIYGRFRIERITKVVENFLLILIPLFARIPSAIIAVNTGHVEKRGPFQ